AIAYSGPVTLNQSTLLRARTYDAATNTWSAITEVGFAMSTPANAANLIISEINYNAADDDAFEFIEFKNISNERIDLTGVQVSSAVNYTFDFAYLDAGEHLVIIKDKDAFNYRYTDPSSPYYYADIQIAGVWESGSLDDSGETIVVTAADLSEIMSFKFDNNNGWPGRANGNGSAAELENPAGVPTLQPAKNDFLAAGNNWRPTSEYHGTPGRDGLGPDNRIVVNEVLAHTDPPLKDSIELFNTTAGTIDISGWFISDATGAYQKFEIPGSTSLTAAGFVAFDEDDFNSSGDPLKDFALNSAEGDEIYLLEADGDGNLLRFVDHVEFGPTKNGESIGRLPDGQGSLYRMCERTFGQSNSSNGNRVCYGPVVINEIHYNPAGSDTDREYIELYNFGDVTETFDNWQLRGEVDYDFAPGITLAPDTALLIVGFPVTDTVRLDGFRAAYNVDPAVTILGPWDNDARLDNGGSTIKLLRPDTLQEPPDAPAFYPMLIEDIVEYDDDPPWTIQPDGNGPSLELISPELDNRLATSWTASWDPNGTAGRHNDDDNPTISIEDILLYEEDSGLVNAVLDVTLSHRSGYTVTADFTTTAGSATAGSDFNTQSGQVEFTPGETDQTITILVNGDELYEGNESFDVTLSNAQNGQLAAEPTATATILDDDPIPTVNIANTVSSAETDLSVTVTVTLSNPSAQTITVDYATADNNALNTLDYTAQNGTLTFTSGVIEQTFTITLLDDNIDEPDETFWVNLSNVSNANLGEDQAVITIMDDEAAPSLTIADGIIVEGNETGNSTALAVTLSHPSSFAVTVDYATADDTATAGSDYVATADTLTFAAGQTSQTITVETIGDITDEVDESFAVNLSNANQATIADATSVVTIIDDEGIPTVNVVDTAVVEGNDGTTQLVFDLLLLPASDQTVTIDYTTADDTATAASDYVAAADTVTFAAGQTSQTVAITVNGDTLFESDETMRLLLSNLTGDALLSDGTAVGTITNDDAAPIVTLASDVSVVEGNSGSTTLTFTATLSTASVVTATMDYATADGSATAGSDYTAVSGSLTFAPGETSKTITVDILADEDPEANETFTLSLSNFTAAQAGTTAITITIIEDDARVIYLPMIVQK
ncbi:MAG: lamin tail domain-containing protein, partial [Anaerolineales bacterium]|nr:lamin tail domain-containing protein [Anaerolineales bacterium]